MELLLDQSAQTIGELRRENARLQRVILSKDASTPNHNEEWIKNIHFKILRRVATSCLRFLLSLRGWLLSSFDPTAWLCQGQSFYHYPSCLPPLPGAAWHTLCGHSVLQT
eukprot:XP_001705063.1 Hypothetical protein GL50803_39513 [Giardia lamblia ATCC 50803]